MDMELEVQCTCRYDPKKCWFYISKTLFKPYFFCDFIAKIQLINYCRMQCTRVGKCTNCFLTWCFVTNVGSALTKHRLRKYVGTMRVSVNANRFKKWFFLRRTYFTWLKNISNNVLYFLYSTKVEHKCICIF